MYTPEMSSSGFSWCSCPHCAQAQSDSIRLRYQPSVPYYDAGHQHYICEWCYLWQRFLPGYEVTWLYKAHGDVLDEIHAYFRGSQALPAREIAMMMNGVASYLKGINDMKVRSPELQKLIGALRILAQEVMAEAVNDSRLYRQLVGGMYSRRQRMIGY